MSDILANLVLGVVANGLTSLIGYVGKSGYAAIGAPESSKSNIIQTANSSLIIQRSLSRSAMLISLFNREREGMQRFLTSPDAETIVRQIYSVQIIANSTVHISDIKRELTLSLSLYLKRDQAELGSAVDQLFDLMVSTCERAMTVATEAGNLGAHEAQSTLRYRVLRDELSAIAHNLQHLSNDEPDIEEVSDFEGRYRRQVVSRHKTITPPDLYGAKRLPIDSIYVLPTFKRNPRKRGVDAEAVDHVQLLSRIHRTVILGTPGAGKSTFAQKVAYELAKNIQQRQVGNRQLSPCLVVLRDYGANRKERKISIRQHLEEVSATDYQIDPPKGVFEHLLRSGRLFVIFDGLDELLDTGHRQQITGDIEAFCELYSNVPVLVTSREVGYDEAPLDQDYFDIVKIAPFESGQVEQYVKK